MNSVPLEKRFAARLARMAVDPKFATVAGLNTALRELAKWRSILIDNTVVAQHGTAIQGGPFRGMSYFAKGIESNVSPKLLGGYETELQPLVEDIVTAGFDCILNIRGGDGYYAVGFAFRAPKTQVFAFDTNPAAQRQCLKLAEMNQVAERVQISGEFRGEDFALYVNRNAFMFVDIEGAEELLLRPDLYPALGRLAILVECHDVFTPGLSEKIALRFADTHAVRRIEPQLHCPTLPSWFGHVSNLDQLLAIWEWRIGPTPWLYLIPSKRSEKGVSFG